MDSLKQGDEWEAWHVLYEVRTARQVELSTGKAWEQGGGNGRGLTKDQAEGLYLDLKADPGTNIRNVRLVMTTHKVIA